MSTPSAKAATRLFDPPTLASDPHRGQSILEGGTALAGATGVLILLHGRCASAANILTLEAEIGRSDFACLAPQAAGSTWYPTTFLAPIERNQPALGSALARLDRIVARLEKQGIASDRVVLAGFSQGACLAVTYATLRARRWGGVIAFTGGLIGPPGPGSSWEGWPDDGSLAGTPVFLGCGDPDPHVPRQRVEETATHLESIGAFVTKKIYPGMGHTIVADEAQHAHALLAGIG
jgi:predicted esterase